jgi:hypothetical protein
MGSLYNDDRLLIPGGNDAREQDDRGYPSPAQSS